MSILATRLLLATLATAISCWAIIILLLNSRARMIFADTPVKAQAMHMGTIPRIGGLAIWSASTLIFLLFGELRALSPAMMAILGAGFVLIVLSAIDDAKSISQLKRLTVHLLAAGAVAISVTDVGRQLPGLAENSGMPYRIFGLVVAILAVAWSANAFNFMDGANGLAGLMGAIGFGALSIGAALADALTLALICAIFAGAAVGFLFHNLPRGRVFLGDSGAVVLGFFAAAVGLYGAVEDIWPILFPMLVFSPFLVDATLTLIKRMLGGQPYWMPHRLHIYQRLILTAGWTHTGVAVVYGVLMTLTATQGVWWIVQKKSAPDVLFWSGRGGNITVLLVWVLTYIALVLLAEWLIRKKQSR